MNACGNGNTYSTQLSVDEYLSTITILLVELIEEAHQVCAKVMFSSYFGKTKRKLMFFADSFVDLQPTFSKLKSKNLRQRGKQKDNMDKELI